MSTKLIPIEKAFRSLESAYNKKTAELDAALKRIAELEAKLEQK